MSPVCVRTALSLLHQAPAWLCDVFMHWTNEIPSRLQLCVLPRVPKKGLFKSFTVVALAVYRFVYLTSASIEAVQWK